MRILQGQIVSFYCVVFPLWKRTRRPAMRADVSAWRDPERDAPLLSRVKTSFQHSSTNHAFATVSWLWPRDWWIPTVQRDMSRNPRVVTTVPSVQYHQYTLLWNCIKLPFLLMLMESTFCPETKPTPWLLIATFWSGKAYFLSVTHRTSWPLLTLFTRLLRLPCTKLPSAKWENDGMETKVDVCTYHQMLPFLLLVPRYMFKPTLYLVIFLFPLVNMITHHQ